MRLIFLLCFVLFCFQFNLILPLQLNISDFLSVGLRLITEGFLAPENGICLPVTMPTSLQRRDFPFFPSLPSSEGGTHSCLGGGGQGDVHFITVGWCPFQEAYRIFRKGSL